MTGLCVLKVGVWQKPCSRQLEAPEDEFFDDASSFRRQVCFFVFLVLIAIHSADVESTLEMQFV